ncbi:MAG: epoxyqueuosine reductase QueH [Candidatus Thermoplasmatota archaeon]|nr:epoxyqueuosine reductase QueH [Candidatus Thermoplasmatota archaeon]
MNILLHTCCGPCLSGSRLYFDEEGIDYTTFWFNPNIYPEKEFNKRFRTLEGFLKDLEAPVIIGCGMDNSQFRSIVGSFLLKDEIPLDYEGEISSRCDICYWIRLRESALKAKGIGADGFCTTLLLSKYQKHDRIKHIGKIIEENIDIDFHYTDLRRYWSKSLNESRRYGLYRQRYCGCDLSLRESIKMRPSIMIKDP